MRLGYLIKIAAALVGIAALGSLLLVYRSHLGAQSALKIAAATLFAVLGISVFVAWNWLFQARAKSIIQKWAAKHHYDVVQFETPLLTGAFSFWTTSRGQVVYSVTVRDDAGCERKAWVRCGGFLGSVLFSHEIEVRWQDEPSNMRIGCKSRT